MSRVKNVKNSKNLTLEQLENKYKQCNKCKEVKLKETGFYMASYGDGYYGECKVSITNLRGVVMKQRRVNDFVSLTLAFQ